MPTADEMIAELERLDGEATKGPWREGGITHESTKFAHEVRFVEVSSPDGAVLFRSEKDPGLQALDDARFVARVRNALPALLAEIRRLRGELRATQGAARTLADEAMPRRRR